MNTNTKPLAEWTLEETYNYCYGYRLGIKPGMNCEETDCLLKKQDICMADYVHDWELTEKPRFTEDEVATMRVLHAAGARYIVRNAVTTCWFTEKPTWREELSMFLMPTGVKYQWGDFPLNSFRCLTSGQSVTIEDIVGRTET